MARVLNIIVLSWLMKEDGQGLRIAVDARREANGGRQLAGRGKQTDMRGEKRGASACA